MSIPYYDHWKTGGLFAGTVDPKVIGICAHCGSEITENDIYWIFPVPLTADDLVCDGCVEGYCRDELGAKRVDEWCE